ncbi:hypothetical protein [Salinarimonas chemoclinalis]|uniref:hypothetical protein n=1 Tax=Salinarimonas chemoclinalis TaxID=3241599 RepID=UPI003558381E
MRGKGLAIVGWSAFAALLVGVGALLLPACGLRLGPIVAAWCADPARAAAAVSPPDELDELLLQVHALEDALVARPVCEVPVRQAEAPVDGQELTLPENEDDLSFLDGCWESPQNENMFEEGTGVRIQYRYCFAGGEGRGTVEIRGTRNGPCRGPMRARRQGDRLVAHYERAACRGGGGFWPGIIECRQGTDRAICDIIDVVHGRPEARDRQIRDATLRRVR